MAEKSGHEHHEHDIYDKAGVGSEAEHVTADVDVIEVTKERPYGETNFIGTYIAVCFGALACYGGFVMPATSLLLINADIGKLSNVFWLYQVSIFTRHQGRVQTSTGSFYPGHCPCPSATL